MNRTRFALPLLLSFLLALLAAGCSAPRAVELKRAEPKPASSVVVLLPEGDKPSGEVTVTNSQGSQVLNESWQSVEISGAGAEPKRPVELPEAEVKGAFATVRAAMPAPPAHFLLYFKLDSTELVPESQAVLPEIARVLRERQPAQLSVVGHADTTGSMRYNYLLGQRRAAVVVELLTSQGGVSTSVETSSRGKRDPLVQTADQTPEPRNRRAEVTIR